MRLAFARQYTKADLERLCKLRRARSGKPLLSGHVTYLLTIEAAVKASKKKGQLTRKDFEQLATDADWSLAQLHAAIRKEYLVKNPTASNPGRSRSRCKAEVQSPPNSTTR